jgi:hypothetical protein
MPLQFQDDNCTKLLDDGTDVTTRQVALARCDCLMDRYLRWKKENKRKSDLGQGAALIFSAITPVLLLLPGAFCETIVQTEQNAKLLGAISAALAAIATGLLAIHHWRENYIRYGYIWHALQNEKFRYLMHVTEEYPAGNQARADSNFAARIEQLVMAEFEEWRVQMQPSERLNTEPGTGEKDGTGSVPPAPNAPV